MKTRRLSGGFEVSQWALGGRFFGTRVDRKQSFRRLDAYLDAGGRWLDTANNYAAWLDGATGDESELLLRDWFAARALPDDLLVATKIGARPAPDAGRAGPGRVE